MNPRIYKNAMDEYLSLPALSSGMIHTLLTQSPAHAKHQQEAAIDDPSTPSERGTAIHDAVLEGVDRCLVIHPEEHRSKPTKADPEGKAPLGWTNNAMKMARIAAREAGRIPLLPDDFDNVVSAAREARAFVDRTELAGLLDDGESEVTLVWDEDGVLCKARADRISRALKVVCHLKTTDGSVAPGSFSRTVDNMGYDLTLAFYERGAAACGLEGYRHVILACEQSALHGCALYDLSPAKAAIAAARVERAIATWRHCVGTNIWPAYDTRVHSLEPKSWELERALENGDMDGLSWSERIELGAQA